jgi:hypothetical protein
MPGAIELPAEGCGPVVGIGFNAAGGGVGGEEWDARRSPQDMIPEDYG